MGGPCYVEGHGQPDVTDNFHTQQFVLNGVEFLCVEQAFQALKFKDPEHQLTVSHLRPEEGPKAAAFGRQCFRAGQQRLDSFRTEWDGIKAEVMYRASRAKFIQNSDSASELLGTGEAKVTRPGDPDGFWALWNCYIMKRIRIELKAPANRSQSETATLQMIESKFELQANIFGGEDTIKSSEFNTCCPMEKYAYEGGAPGRPGRMPPAEVADARPGRGRSGGGARPPQQNTPGCCPCCSIQ